MGAPRGATPQQPRPCSATISGKIRRAATNPTSSRSPASDLVLHTPFLAPVASHSSPSPQQVQALPPVAVHRAVPRSNCREQAPHRQDLAGVPQLVRTESLHTPCLALTAPAASPASRRTAPAPLQLTEPSLAACFLAGHKPRPAQLPSKAQRASLPASRPDVSSSPTPWARSQIWPSSCFFPSANLAFIQDLQICRKTLVLHAFNNSQTVHRIKMF